MANPTVTFLCIVADVSADISDSFLVFLALQYILSEEAHDAV